MKHRLALLVAFAVIGLSAAVPGLAGVDRRAAPAASWKTCRGYVRGVIGGRVKCLRRGEYCALRYRSQYVRYGFRCYGSPARLH